MIVTASAMPLLQREAASLHCWWLGLSCWAMCPGWSAALAHYPGVILAEDELAPLLISGTLGLSDSWQRCDAWQGICGYESGVQNATATILRL